MSETPRHQNVIQTEQVGDEMITIPASIIIQTLSYLEELGIVKKEVEKRKITSHQTILADVLSCLNVFKETPTREVVITVTTDKWGEPTLVKHRYVLEKRNVS